jgi:hypothetical protein
MQHASWLLIAAYQNKYSFGQLYSSEIEGKWELENRNKLSNKLTMYIWEYILDWNLDQTRNIEYIKLPNNIIYYEMDICSAYQKHI